MGAWQGRPCSCQFDGTWRHRTPSRGKGGPGPRGQLERQAHRGRAPTCGGAGPPRRSGPVVAIPKYLALMGTWGRRTYISSGGRSGDHGPSYQVRTIRPVS
jgi:hypothetical protein